ncbi:transcriptional activator protein [Velvet bean golden mosaic virus]|uniref:Transcriptional activator protein n=1 Tax=Velvet bean golden mosaic virus TaxID=1881630 RepID=A0A1B1UUF1_9GEMI|nr:transcriptional activator protein [Velvet bean golden mosaic virus]ANW06443.1 transcriptional activator protein [Velvet bean golden mosaic virus]ANW06450.1 transcriptional activator protein [Velvet bean golden mosaic virus]ANW06455.1 transcriptional activator protein [Velvet bean golden mosaic virus]ANW06461.1 transcriptional activator protein [Velvet bean golden mosaic virus]ANW06467.1 transcriptional activator protein [Velvet bean golden mosaic virus]
MRNSTPSKHHSSPPSIKAQHRCAKKKAIRRKRIDLSCGCTYYMHINCSSHGFTHRGEHHCGSTKEWRLYLGDKKSPLFRDFGALPNTKRINDDGHQNAHQIQPRSEESTADAQVLPQPDNLPLFEDDFWDDIINF